MFLPMFDRLAVLAAALLTTAAVAQTTWIVDAGGGGSFTAIGPAFDAAAPGDTILVRPGNYLGFGRSPAKGVRILGDGPGVVVTSPIVLRQLPYGQHLHLGGFRVDAANNAMVAGYGFVPAALSLEVCWSFSLSELELQGPHGSVLPGTGLIYVQAGLFVYRSRGVVGNVKARGGDGAPGREGGAGLLTGSSEVALSACSFQAGAGQPGAPPLAALCIGDSSSAAIDECSLGPGSPGGLALDVSQSRALLANHAGAIGGHVALSMGPGSLEYEGPVTAAPTSLPLLPRAQPGLVGPSSVPRGGTLVWTTYGAAGQIGLAVASLGTQPSLLPALDTWLFTATLPSSAFLGAVVVGAGGSATLSFAVPNLPWLADEHIAMQVVGWLGQPTWKASGVALTRIR